MSEIVYLQPGTRPPKDQPFVLIECRRGRGGDELLSHSSGITVRTSPEFLAETISDFQAHGIKIFVRGGGRSVKEVRSNPPKKHRSRRAETPTIEELNRESEISASVADKLHTTVETLMHLVANPHLNVVGAVRRKINDYLSAAPGDSYAQRRALEKLNTAIGRMRLSQNDDPRSYEVWRTTIGLVLPKLFDAWKRR